MRIIPETIRLTIHGKEGGTLKLCYECTGEPHNEGLLLCVDFKNKTANVLMDASDARKMRNKLNQFLGEST